MRHDDRSRSPRGRGFCFDCGPGSTRMWSCKSLAPILHFGKIAKLLMSEKGRKKFADEIVNQLDGKPAFIGATAGVRYALHNRVDGLTDDHVSAFQRLLPPECEFRVVRGREEAAYECASLRVQYPDDPTCSFISMGGRSMQFGKEGALYSMPFGQFWAKEYVERDPSVSLAAVVALYRNECIKTMRNQKIPLVKGNVACVVDAMKVVQNIEPARINGPPMTPAQLIQLLDNELQRRGPTSSYEFGRQIALKVLVSELLDSECSVYFPRLDVNWPEGYFQLGSNPLKASIPSAAKRLAAKSDTSSFKPENGMAAMAGNTAHTHGTTGLRPTPDEAVKNYKGNVADGETAGFDT